MTDRLNSCQADEKNVLNVLCFATGIYHFDRSNYMAIPFLNVKESYMISRVTVSLNVFTKMCRRLYLYILRKHTVSLFLVFEEYFLGCPLALRKLSAGTETMPQSRNPSVRMF